MNRQHKITQLQETLTEYAARAIPDTIDGWASIQQRIVAAKPGQHTHAQLDTSNNIATLRAPAASPPAVPPKQARRFSWSLALAATAILALGGLLAGFLSLGNGLSLGSLFKQKTPEPVLFTEGFENGLDQWHFTGNAGTVYENGIDNNTFHSGGASTFIEPVVEEPYNSGWSVRVLDAKEYLDKRIRFSAYVKLESDYQVASLGMIVWGDLLPKKADQQGERARLLGKDAMYDRPIRGKGDWHQYSIVLDVPADAKDITIYFQSEGKGRAWFDDFTLSVADGDVPVTNMFRTTELQNAGFEQGLTGWGVSSFISRAFEWGTDSETKYNGNASGVINRSIDVTRDGVNLYLSQFVSTADYRGKRIRFSAQIKTENVKDQATLWIGARDIADRPMSPDTVGTESHTGTADWQKYQAEINVPNDSLYFLIFIGLEGQGKMWIDDVKLEVIGNYVPPTPTPPKP